MAKKIPQYILEAIDCGEEKAEKYYDLYGQYNLESELEKLRKSDEEILAKYSPDAMYAKLNNEPIVVPKSRFSYSTWTKLGAIAAAVVVLFVSVTNISRISPAGKAVASDSIRQKGVAKGTPQLFVYRKNGSDAEMLSNNDECSQGDVLQIAYNPNGSRYGLIFSVDGNGNLTSHFPENTLRAGKLEGLRGTKYLDYSYELDDAPKYEIFIMVTSSKPFSVDEEDVVIQGKSLHYLQNGKYLPNNTNYTTVTIKKTK